MADNARSYETGARNARLGEDGAGRWLETSKRMEGMSTFKIFHPNGKISVYMNTRQGWKHMWMLTFFDIKNRAAARGVWMGE